MFNFKDGDKVQFDTAFESKTRVGDVCGVALPD